MRFFCTNPPADPRAEELLTSVRRVFAEKGFDGASMQDLARGAGISPGNFYRYFPSKAAIVEALIARDMAEVDRQFAEALSSPEPLRAAREIFRARITDAPMEDCQIWAEITAVAMRKPDIARATQIMQERIVGNIVRLISQTSGLSEDEASARFGAQAQLIFLLVKGSNLQRTLDGPPGDDLIALLVRVVDNLIDDLVPVEGKSR